MLFGFVYVTLELEEISLGGPEFENTKWLVYLDSVTIFMRSVNIEAAVRNIKGEYTFIHTLIFVTVTVTIRNLRNMLF
jgi:hypothetical protein